MECGRGKGQGSSQSNIFCLAGVFLGNSPSPCAPRPRLSEGRALRRIFCTIAQQQNTPSEQPGDLGAMTLPPGSAELSASLLRQTQRKGKDALEPQISLRCPFVQASPLRPPPPNPGESKCRLVLLPCQFSNRTTKCSSSSSSDEISIARSQTFEDGWLGKQGGGREEHGRGGPRGGCNAGAT